MNGKNIWKNNYKKTLALLSELKTNGINTVISSSCSLLHVPYTLKNETKLSVEYTSHFSFAEEKLIELAELKFLTDTDNFENETAYIANCKLFLKTELIAMMTLFKKRVAGIQEKDFTRLPEFNEREKIQKKEFELPILPTTTIGSIPQTSDVKANRSSFKKGNISENEYNEFNRKKRLPSAFLCKRKSDLMYSFMVNLKEMIWLNISENSLTAISLLKSLGTVIRYTLCKTTYYLGRCFSF